MKKADDEQTEKDLHCQAKLCGGKNRLKVLGSVALYLADGIFNLSNDTEKDLENIQTDQDAVHFIETYLSKELRANYLELYHSDRQEMNRTPRQAIDNLLSLPPL